MTTTEKLTPETVHVGQGVTMSINSDEYPATVWTVSPSGKTFTFTIDKVEFAAGGAIFTPQEPFSTEEYGFPQTNIKTARWNTHHGPAHFIHAKYCHLSAGQRWYRNPSV